MTAVRPEPRPRDATQAGSQAFLPTTRSEMRARGISELDILIVTGDAYVDHPSFGPVLVARFLEGRGYKVGIVAQPAWTTPDEIARMGRPRLFVGISAGNLDSMLNRLTAQKKVRSTDPYSPGGRAGLRPNRATLVYANLCRQAFPGLPIVLGGIEASLRRIAHYDYWSDSVRRSMLLDAKADLLVFGMGENAAWEIARRLDAGESIRTIRDVRGTAFPLHHRGEWQLLADDPSRFVTDGKVVVLPSFEEVSTDKRAFAEMSRRLQLESQAFNGRPLLQPHGAQAVYLNPPSMPLSEAEMDALYDLPFTRSSHPSYTEGVPALETVKHSIVTMRGCFGGCTFCSITEHEGRVVQSRSKASVIDEVRLLSRMDGFSGTITDVGGPTANMYQLRCKDPEIERKCRRLSCVHPGVCKHLETDHEPLIDLLKTIRKEPKIKRVYLASGIRYDLAARHPEFTREVARHHTGGQLSVAPEHNDENVLEFMRKPPIESYEAFARTFESESLACGKDQYLVPYFIIGHPGSSLTDTIALALYLKSRGMRPRQIQEFIPTPMALATAMYYTGLDPQTGKPVHVARDLREKRMMKALILYWDEGEWPLAREALTQAGRTDLIGRASHCLIPPANADRRGGAANPSRGPRRRTEPGPGGAPQRRRTPVGGRG